MKKNKRPPGGQTGKKIRWLIVVWAAVLLIGALLLLISQVTGWQIGQHNFQALSVLINFSAFVATSFFGVSIYHHNATVRELNNEIRNQTNAVNKRAEAFRNLQFISSNYTIVDFVDFMTIYPEYEIYRAKLLESKQFDFYLLGQGLDKETIIKNFSGYSFLTVRIPLKIIEGKAIGNITFKRMKFIKGDEVFRFLPAKDTVSKALILFNENDNRSEALINLIMPNDSNFYNANELNPFSKIKISLQTDSLLGVAVNGVIELYFTNPEKIEKTGTSKYKINSSHFELIGAPKLNMYKEYEVD